MSEIGERVEIEGVLLFFTDVVFTNREKSKLLGWPTQFKPSHLHLPTEL